MGQSEVFETLGKRKGSWLSAEEIAVILKVENLALIRRALKKLLKYREVSKKEVKNRVGAIMFKYEYGDFEV